MSNYLSFWPRRSHAHVGTYQTITEFGTHDELLKRGGSYAALYHASL